MKGVVFRTMSQDGELRYSKEVMLALRKSPLAQGYVEEMNAEFMSVVPRGTRLLGPRFVLGLLVT